MIFKNSQDNQARPLEPRQLSHPFHLRPQEGRGISSSEPSVVEYRTIAKLLASDKVLNSHRCWLVRYDE